LIAGLEEALCGRDGALLLQALSRLSLGTPLAPEQRQLIPVLARLGLGTASGERFVLGTLGHQCADAAREYVLWQARGRRLHWEGSLPALQLGNFRDKRILEVGPGWGCNLFRLRSVTPHVRGREIEALYTRFTPIFARMEGIEPPPIDVGGGEALPYPDGSFDWVLLFSTLQYMDARAAIREFARVLAPGGRLLSSQPMLPKLLAELTHTLSRPGAMARKGAMLCNSLSYRLVGRRLLGNVAGRSTARPVYFTRRQLAQYARQAGLVVLSELSALQPEGREFILVAEKPSTQLSA
jgi:SAM-dependent methyltransferase